MEGREGWEGKREGRRRVGEGGEMGEGGGREREGKGMGKRREGKGPQEKFDKSSTATQPPSHVAVAITLNAKASSLKRNELSSMSQHAVHLGTRATPSEWRWT